MKILTIIFCSLLWAFAPALAENRLQDQITDITSDKMTYTGHDNIVIFSGNVHVIRAELELWSDQLHVHIKPQNAEQDEADQQDNIEKIIARGNVRIKSMNREGKGELLTYNPDTGQATLEGNPVLMEDKNRVEGEIVLINMLENTSEVLGGPDRRVRVIFYSESEQQE